MEGVRAKFTLSLKGSSGSVEEVEDEILDMEMAYCKGPLNVLTSYARSDSRSSETGAGRGTLQALSTIILGRPVIMLRRRSRV